MKRRDKKFISMVTAVALSISMVLNYSTVSVKGADISQEDLKELLKTKIEDYEKTNLKNRSGKAQLDAADENTINQKDPEEEIRVIVQLDDAPAIEEEDGADYTDSTKYNEKNIKDSQSTVIAKAEEITGSQVRRSFGYLVNGFSINTKRKNIDALSEIDGVKCVTEVRSYKPTMETAKDILGAKGVWKNLGYQGEGMVVSIIDTGIDYRHKDLQSIDTNNTKLKKSAVTDDVNKLGYGQYFTDKVPYGYNYADENTNVIDTGNMHGMHVAGIVAANGDDSKTSTYEAVKGVAPQAQLLAMKVFTNNPTMGSAFDDDIIAAIEDSVKLGADVINMSLGSTAGFTDPNDPENQAVQRATDAGVMCVISAGNSGTSTEKSDWDQPTNRFGMKDTATIGSPSTASSSLSVASMENTTVTASAMAYETTNGFKNKIEYSTPDKSLLDEFAKEFTLVDCGSGDEEGFLNKDVNGKVALIKRGVITFQEKYDRAVANGAAGVIIYNNGEDIPIGMSISNITKPVISVGYSQGTEIKKHIEDKDDTFKFSFSGQIVASENPDVSDMSQYTSWGTAPDLEFKPEITAPGGDIYSLANNDSYQVMSGTSMAAPNTAGSEALIMQAVKKQFKNLSGDELVRFVKNTAMNTAKPMIDKYDETKSIPYSPRRQGAGLLDIENAINNKVIVKYKDGKGAAALKEVGNTTEFELTLTNYGEKEVTYNLNDAKVYGEGVNDKFAIKEEVLNGSTAKFDRKSVTLKAGESATVKVTLNIAENEKIDRFVEGYLDFTSTDESVPSLSVPFMGFYGDWSKESIIDAPQYKDSTNSLVGSSGLVSKTKGLYGSYVEDGKLFIDKDKVAFSPNGDKFKDTVTPALYFLRNAKELKVSVLDKDGNEVRALYDAEKVRKNVLTDGIEPSSLGGAVWDGTIYDAAKGKYVKAEDGNYTVRVTSKVDYEKAKDQTLDLPVKIDTKAPEVKIKGVEKYTDDKGDHFKLSWEAKDNDGESGVMPVYEAAVDGQNVDIDSSTVTKVGNVYSADIPFTDGAINDVTIAVSDYAGNITTAESKEKASELKTISVSGLKDGMVIGESDLKDGKFLVKGTASDAVKKLEVNGKEVEVKDNYFTEAVEVKDGDNTVKVYAEDKDGQVVYDTTYKVILDRQAPEVTLGQALTEAAPYFTTEEKELEVNVTVKDDTEATAYLLNETEKDAKEVEVSLDAAKKGTGKVNLVEGLNKIKLVVTDKAGNKTTKEYLVMKGDSTAKLSVTVDNLAYYQYFNAKDLTNGIYTVKGHVNKKKGSLKIDGQEVKVNDDLTFTYDKKVTAGRNLIKIYAVDEDQKVTADYAYKIFYDNEAPSLELDTPELRGDNKIYVNNENFNLKGVLKENLFGYSLYVNGERLLYGEEDPVKRGEGIEKAFAKDIKLALGENIIKLTAADINGNSLDQDLTVVLDKEAPAKPKVALSTDELTNKPVSVTLTSDEKQLDRMEYSTDGVNFVKYTGEFTVAASAKVYARAVDYAGNVSDVTDVEVKIDTTKPVVTLNGVTDGQIYYEPVKLSADVDKDAKTTILVNGKEYTGEAIETEGKYVVEAYAEDEAGNKSETIKKSFELAQNSTVVTEDGMDVIKHNNVKGENSNLYESLTSNNLKVDLSDAEKGAVVTGKDTVVSLPESLIKEFKKDKLEYTQKVYEDEKLLSGLNSLGKVYEMALNNGENIVDLGDNKITVTLKLSPEDLKTREALKLKAYMYDEDAKEWKALDGKLNDTTSDYTFTTNKLGKFTLVKEQPEEGSNPGESIEQTQNGNDTKIQKNAGTKNNSVISSKAKTGDSIVFAGALAAVAVVAAAIAFFTRKKKKNL